MKRHLFVCVSIAFLSACQHNTESNTYTQADSTVIINVADQAIYSRAFDAVIWGMPAVNSELMYESLVQAKGDYNQVAYWSGLINSKNQTLTPNPDVIYLNPMYDTRKGPVVLEIPAAEGVSSITGSIDDAWQTAIEDIGPAGVDKGKGGKYLILPPGYKNKVPADYFPMQSSVYTGYAILRSNLTDGSKEDIERAVAYGKKVKIYPYSNSGTATETIFTDLLQVPFGNTIPYDIRFFEVLNRFVQREPWLTRDMAMIDQLKTIGIEKGKSFHPDDKTKKILSKAISDAHAWLDHRYEALFTEPFYDNTHWALPAEKDVIKAISENYIDSNEYPLAARATVYSIAYFSSKHLGSGQFYLMSNKDKNNNILEGAKSYHLHIPANVPVKLYWSVTAYDRETHALIQNMPYFSKASTSSGIQKNADGSVDIYFGSKAPAGKEANWVPTDAKRNFELLTRFYGPEKEFFEKKWTMGDVEELK